MGISDVLVIAAMIVVIYLMYKVFSWMLRGYQKATIHRDLNRQEQVNRLHNEVLRERDEHRERVHFNQVRRNLRREIDHAKGGEPTWRARNSPEGR